VFVLGGLVCLAWVGITGFLFGLGGGVTAWGMPPGAGSLLGIWRRLFFSWPDLFGPVFLQWVSSLPLITLLVSLAFVWRLSRLLGGSVKDMATDPAMVCLYFFVLVGLFESLFSTIRYTFFLYPLGFVVLGQAVVDLLRGLFPAQTRLPRDGLAAIILVLLFSVSRDFNPTHLANVAGTEQTFRTGTWEGYDRVWYQRWDFASPAEFVRDQARASEQVVTMNLPVASYYLDRSHIVFVPRERAWQRYTHIARDEGRLDAWSLESLAGTVDELTRRLGRTSGGPETVWFLDVVPMSVELGELLSGPGWGGRQEYVSRDGRIQVIRADYPGPDPNSGN
jgi:hypothetical protein